MEIRDFRFVLYRFKKNLCVSGDYYVDLIRICVFNEGYFILENLIYMYSLVRKDECY